MVTNIPRSPPIQPAPPQTTPPGWVSFLERVGATLTAASAFLQFISSPWPPYATSILFVVGISVGGIALCIAFAVHYRWHDKAREFVDRFSGPDLAKYRYFPQRLAIAVAAAVYRACLQFLSNERTRTALLAATLSSLSLPVLWLYLGSRASVHPRKMYLHIGIVLFFVFYFVAVVLEQARKRLRQGFPLKRLEDQLYGVISSWRGDGSAFDNGLAIATEDPGPIRVYAINFIELLDFRAASIDREGALLREVWAKHPEKEFCWLFADPTTKHIRRRNRRLNGRYIQYYVQRFLRLILAWQSEQQRAGNRPRIHLRIYKDRPAYRMLLSDERAVVQMYHWNRHGRDDLHVVLHRVVRSGRLREEVVSCTAQTLQAYSSAPGNQKPNVQPCLICANDKLKALCKPDPKGPGTYAHFLGLFKSAWDSAREPPFLDDWHALKLCDLARRCGVDRSKLRECGAVSWKIADELCAKLGLEADLIEARPAR